METQALFPSTDRFSARHLGPGDADVLKMLTTVGVSSLETLVSETVPAAIRMSGALKLAGIPQGGRSEAEILQELRAIASENTVNRSYLGMGYSDTVTPPVILRNILENPGWYTQYTPYQAEIAQGRLEALLNFQTMVGDLTGLPVAGASLLDEGTAAAEAVAMAWSIRGRAEAAALFISELCHPQTIAVVKSRAEALKLKVLVGDHEAFDFSRDPVFAVLVQYPGTDGEVSDYSGFFARAHEHSAMTICAADILSLAVLRPPGEFGADIAVGTTQRFGVPMGFGGPHAAFLSTREEFKRQMPGRIVGLSKDADGRPAARLALQTREQHIRRDKATSNICTAQVLLAVVASMYAIYHGPEGLKAIASRIHAMTATLRAHLLALGYEVQNRFFFDSIRIKGRKGAALQAALHAEGMNIRLFPNGDVGVSLDETTGDTELLALLKVFAAHADRPAVSALQLDPKPRLGFSRESSYLGHPVFQSYHSETELLRYMTRLQSKDLSLTHSMIPLGSCTMKLNATAEMIPVTWREFGGIHPFAPSDQTRGYQKLIQKLETHLSEITGFAATSLQPNAGSQGEYAGLLVIKAYQESRGQGHRDVCLIPLSAHGTNPASAVMAGYRVVGVKTDSLGNIDVADLKTRAEEHATNLAALMITYPSTHGVFEESVKEICSIIHQHGGQVYMDGANMNAQVGLCRPGDMGADVCHLNLHKTFCIPHGGGGPGMGPICVAPQLKPFLPGHPVVAMGGAKAIGPVSAAPWGSPSILPISFAYIEMMGAQGLERATQIAILNANYLAERLHPHFPVLYRGTQGRVAHECILDLRAFKTSAGVEAEDVAKRLMDYGFHAPTLSWPVTGTLMIEPTESESLAELNRFADALISIRQEIREIEEGRADRLKNVLKFAPHTAEQVSSDSWDRPYSRQKAAYPLPWVRERKFWPSVARIDNVYGDRNLVCTCAPMEDYAST